MCSSDLRRLFPRERLRPCTAKSHVTRRALESELALIRDRGYATSVGESEPDIAAIGAAIVYISGAVCANARRILKAIEIISEKTKSE